MKSVKIREIAEALRCARLKLSLGPGLEVSAHLSSGQAEMLAELAIRGMTTPTAEMLRAGLGEAPITETPNDELDDSDMQNIWEAMCREALR